jgi:Zn-dependent peptidase ImmA (M78 family)
MAKRTPALINADMLTWARETAGYSVEDIAAWLHKDPDVVSAWEAGEKALYMGTLRELANHYKRPVSDFYLPARPAEQPFPHDFRRLPGEVAGKYTPELRKQLRFARERQEAADYLLDQAHAGVTSFDHRAELAENPETVGQRVRELLGMSLDEQRTWETPYAAFSGWRSYVERMVILVFKFEDVEVEEAAGFSIRDGQPPVIGLNVKLHPFAQTFTLMHEFTHLLLREGATCDTDDHTARGANELRTEVFCNHVAAATLMPRSEFLSHPVIDAHGKSPEWGNDEIRQIANSFCVSRESTVRRLLTFNLTTHPFYRAKRDEYQEEYKHYRERQRERNKGKKFPRSPVSRAIANLGNEYIRIVLDSYGNRRITLADAADLMDVGPTYVRRIQEKAFGG